MASDRGPTPRDVPLISFLTYNSLVVPLAVAAFHLSRLTSEKVRAGVEGRRDLFARLSQRARELQGCVWFHASSAGEYEQARPILRALRAAREKRGETVPTLLTVFSPSGYRHARENPESDVVEYLPLDTAPAAWRMVSLLKPRALVFVSFDCWPNMVWAARRREVPVLLLNGNFHGQSKRKQPLARGFFRRLFDSFSCIGAIGQEDARRFREDLGVTTPVHVTGDTRTDQVIHRFERSREGPLAKALRAQPHRYVVLGSIWPSDEEVILAPALEAVAAQDDVGLILVPHEPKPSALERLQAALAEAGLTGTRLSELVEVKTRARRATAAAKDSARWRIILVDTVGMLAEIYAASILTYVGGSFSTGVHNVLEPAVAGQPVMFGPRIHNAHEAGRLVEVGAARVVHTQEEARQVLRQWLQDEPRRQTAAEAARASVHDHSGATRANLELLLPYA
jgi:3-deoxy-D-manno-octulosonic-acid transferase